jgi:hypothetical protein
MEEIILIVLVTLAIVAVPSLLWMLLVVKGSKMTAGQSMNQLARGPRYRDGAVTYRQFEGVRCNIKIENPYDHHNARYQRRHRSGQHKQTKPWMK